MFSFNDKLEEYRQKRLDRVDRMEGNGIPKMALFSTHQKVEDASDVRERGGRWHTNSWKVESGIRGGRWHTLRPNQLR